MHSSIQKTDGVVQEYVAQLRETEFTPHNTKLNKPAERPVIVVDQLDR